MSTPRAQHKTQEHTSLPPYPRNFKRATATYDSYTLTYLDQFQLEFKLFLALFVAAHQFQRAKSFRHNVTYVQGERDKGGEESSDT